MQSPVAKAEIKRDIIVNYVFLLMTFKFYYGDNNCIISCILPIPSSALDTDPSESTAPAAGVGIYGGAIMNC